MNRLHDSRMLKTRHRVKLAAKAQALAAHALERQLAHVEIKRRVKVAIGAHAHDPRPPQAPSSSPTSFPRRWIGRLVPVGFERVDMGVKGAASILDGGAVVIKGEVAAHERDASEPGS